MLPSDASPEARVRGRTALRRYLAVVVVEFVAIFLAANLLGSAGLDPLIPLVVGLHFLPLAAVFGVRLYYVTGALIPIPATVSVVALLIGTTLGNPFGWSLVSRWRDHSGGPVGYSVRSPAHRGALVGTNRSGRPVK